MVRSLGFKVSGAVDSLCFLGVLKTGFHGDPFLSGGVAKGVIRTTSTVVSRKLWDGSL